MVIFFLPCRRSIGSRMAGADTEMPLVRRVGNMIFATLLTMMGRTLVTDSASGMRVSLKPRKAPAAMACAPDQVSEPRV